MSLLTWPVGIFCFIGALLLGRDIACGFGFDKRPRVTIYLSVAILLNVLIIVALLLLAFFDASNRLIWIGTLMAPIGGLGRHYLGSYLNGKVAWKRTWPLGTFIANVTGSAILMMAIVIGTSAWRSDQMAEEENTVTLLARDATPETTNATHGDEPHGADMIRQLVLSGKDPFSTRDLFLAIVSGTCASLSTISSFVNDITTLPARSRHFYWIATVATTQLIAIIILLIAMYTI